MENAERAAIFTIDGPCCPYQSVCCRTQLEFPVSSFDGGHTIGRLYKQWGGVVRELFTVADIYRIEFPMNLDVKMKALFLGATFLIDFVYYEQDRYLPFLIPIIL